MSPGVFLAQWKQSYVFENKGVLSVPCIVRNWVGRKKTNRAQFYGHLKINKTWFLPSGIFSIMREMFVEITNGMAE